MTNTHTNKPPVATEQKTSGLRVGSPAKTVANAPVNTLMITVAVIWLLPTFGLFIQSLRSGADIGQSGWWTALLQPEALSLAPYWNLLDYPGMERAFLNTFVITLPSTFFVVLFGALAGYALAWIPFKGRDTIFLIVVGLLVVPTQMAFIPIAQLYRILDIFGSVTGVILFHISFGLPFAVFLLRNFFVGIPAELLEAARVDGAGHITLFLKVIMPLATPALASLSIFQFLWVWNDLLVALIFAEPSAAPLTTAILQQMRTFSSSVDIIAPGAFLQMLVPLIVFFSCQRYFVQGIMGGALKN